MIRMQRREAVVGLSVTTLATVVPNISLTKEKKILTCEEIVKEYHRLDGIAVAAHEKLMKDFEVYGKAQKDIRSFLASLKNFKRIDF